MESLGLGSVVIMVIVGWYIIKSISEWFNMQVDSARAEAEFTQFKNAQSKRLTKAQYIANQNEGVNRRILSGRITDPAAYRTAARRKMSNDWDNGYNKYQTISKMY